LSTDGDSDGHYTTDSCFTPHDDCDDNNAAIWDCNTPVSPDPVTVEDTNTGVSITYPNVTSGGDTTVTPNDCSGSPIPDFLTYDGAAPLVCTDITTDATSDLSGGLLIEVCLPYDDTGMTPFQERSLKVIHCKDNPNPPPPSTCSEALLSRLIDPDAVPPEICVWTDGLSQFAVGTLTNRDGDPFPDLTDLCPDVFSFTNTDMDGDGLGDVCDPDLDGDRMPNVWETDNGTNPNVYDACEDPDGDGYVNQVEHFLGMNPQVTDTSVPSVTCTSSAWDLKVGFNMVSLCGEGAGYSAYTLLQAIGNESVVASIQRFNPVTGAMDTAGYDGGGTPGGVDFQIVPNEGYVIYMFQEINGFTP